MHLSALSAALAQHIDLDLSNATGSAGLHALAVPPQEVEPHMTQTCAAWTRYSISQEQEGKACSSAFLQVRSRPDKAAIGLDKTAIRFDKAAIVDKTLAGLDKMATQVGRP